jgi:hypothetical protein
MEEKELQNELASIRSLMERSSKFISLSGLSGILAGVYALIGAGLVYNSKPLYLRIPPYVNARLGGLKVNFDSKYIWEVSLIGALVLIASIATALILSSRQARRKGQPMWGSVSRSLLFHMCVPLIAGGVMVLILAHQYNYDMVAPVMLIFYGMSLVSASNFTFTDIKYLGLCEVILGLIAACLPGYGLLFWALGFGVLHIIYGSMMYFKYDK